MHRVRYERLTTEIQRMLHHISIRHQPRVKQDRKLHFCSVSEWYRGGTNVKKISLGKRPKTGRLKKAKKGKKCKDFALKIESKLGSKDILENGVPFIFTLCEDTVYIHIRNTWKGYTQSPKTKYVGPIPSPQAPKHRVSETSTKKGIEQIQRSWLVRLLGLLRLGKLRILGLGEKICKSSSSSRSLPSSKDTSATS